MLETSTCGILQKMWYFGIMVGTIEWLSGKHTLKWDIMSSWFLVTLNLKPNEQLTYKYLSYITNNWKPLYINALSISNTVYQSNIPWQSKGLQKKVEITKSALIKPTSKLTHCTLIKEQVDRGNLKDASYGFWEKRCKFT